MGTQYEILNEDTNEFITANSLGWDYKYHGSCWSDFNNLLIFLLHRKWNGAKIRMIATEHLEDKETTLLKDITLETLEKYKEEYKNIDPWWLEV